MISVIVCTHNRADLLPYALQTLGEQSLDSNEYEVIVVDNNSTDDTRIVVEKFAHEVPNLRYCLETKTGLSHARNRGWNEARGEYVAYTDDDCKLPRPWLSVAKEIIEQKAPAVLGGPYFAFYDSPKPHWFKDSYGSYELHPESCALSQKEFLVGGNIFFRRKLLETLGGFDANLGMSGDKIAYGEETALQIHIRDAMPGQVIYYDPRLYVYHLVRPEKMQLNWLIRAFFAKSRYVYLVSRNNKIVSALPWHSLIKATKIIIAFAADLLFGVWKRDHKRYPYYQNYLYEHTSQYLRSLGRLYEQHVGTR